MLRSFCIAALLILIAAPAIAQRRCTTGIPCGNTCIAANRTCRVGTGNATSSTTTQQQTAKVAPAVPEGTQYVASTRGEVFYWVGCDSWHNLAAANLRYFRTAEEARAAGLRPSSQSACAPRSGAVAAAATAAAASPIPASSAPGTCAVARVIDGDTLECGGGLRVRLLLVDAPEMNQGPFGEVARLQLEQVAPVGKVLRMEYDVQKQDRYGRELAYLFLDDGRMVNEELLRAGVAVVSVYPPNVRYVDRFRAVSDSAKAARVGLWSGSAFSCLPEDHRAGRCQP